MKASLATKSVNVGLFIILAFQISLSQLSYAQESNPTSFLPAIVTHLLSDEESCSDAIVIAHGITLTNQSEVAALRGVTNIEGDLVIAPTTSSLDLSPLSQLKEVSGNFQLVNNSIQTNVSGFNCMEIVGGNFYLGSTNTAGTNQQGNQNLATVSGFSKLRAVSGDFQISANNSLTAVSNFLALESVGNTELSFNPQLAALPNFPVLQSTGVLRIASNDALTTIPEFPELANIGVGIGGRFNIFGNGQLISIGGFPALTEIGGAFDVFANASLVSLSEFPLLESVHGELIVGSNFNLQTIDGFNSLTLVGSDLLIQGNGLLSSISGFQLLNQAGIVGSSTINMNANLDCRTPEVNFSPVSSSIGNLVNCFTGFTVPGGIVRLGDDYIGLEFLNASTLSQAQFNAFISVTTRWSEIVDGSESQINTPAGAEGCFGQQDPERFIDGLIIQIDVSPIDGQGGVVGSASPLRLRPGSLPFLGCMQFDSADLDAFQASGNLENLLLREMARVLGFGSLWSAFGLIIDPLPGALPNLSLPQPQYVGPSAVAAFRTLDGVSPTSNSIPVENGFTNGVINGAGPGSVNNYWSKEVFDNELMTFVLGSSSSPLSIVTIASLADLGYTVDFGLADSFFIE